LENKRQQSTKVLMRNRTTAIILVVFVTLIHCSRAEIPETVWLREYVASKSHMFDELGMRASQYAGELNAERLGKLRALVTKVGSGASGLEDGDYEAASAAVRMLSAANAQGVVETVSPLLQSNRALLRSAAAQALATAGGDAAVNHIEQALQRRAAALASGDMKEQQEVADYLRCLAAIGTPKARAAFERGRNQAATAAESKGAAERDRVRQKADAIWSATARP
jgi:hypothetical protein